MGLHGSSLHRPGKAQRLTAGTTRAGNGLCRSRRHIQTLCTRLSCLRVVDWGPSSAKPTRMRAGYGFCRRHIQMFDPGFAGYRARGKEDAGAADGGADPLGVLTRHAALRCGNHLHGSPSSSSSPAGWTDVLVVVLFLSQRQQAVHSMQPSSDLTAESWPQTRSEAAHAVQAGAGAGRLWVRL